MKSPFALLIVVLCCAAAAAFGLEKPAPAAAKSGPVLRCFSAPQPFDEIRKTAPSCDEVCGQRGAACVAVETVNSWARCGDTPASRGNQPPGTTGKTCRCCRVEP